MSWGSWGAPATAARVSDAEIQGAVAAARRAHGHGSLGDLNDTPAEGSIAQEATVVDVVDTTEAPAAVSSAPVPKSPAETALVRPTMRQTATKYFQKYGKFIGGGLLLFGVVGLLFLPKRK